MRSDVCYLSRQFRGGAAKRCKKFAVGGRERSDEGDFGLVSYDLKKGICVYAVGVQMPTVIRSGDGYRVVQGRRWLPETPFFGELVS